MSELARRFFLRTSEILPLWLGIAQGDSTALRRAIGARRSGRVAALLGVLGLWLGTGWVGWVWPAAVQLGLTAIGTSRSEPGLTWLEYQRLSLWLAGPAAALAFPLRETGTGALVCAGLVLAAHVWLWRHLGHGLGAIGAD